MLKSKRYVMLAILISSFLFVIIPDTPLSSALIFDDFYEDFEGDVFSEWSMSGFWHLEENSTAAFSGSRFMWYANNITGDYNGVDVNGTGVRNSGFLVTIPMDLTGFNGSFTEFSFMSFSETENTDIYDVRNVSIISGGTEYFLGNIFDTSYWHHYTFDISAYCFADASFVFAFDTIDGYNNEHFGWAIDDVMISTPDMAVEADVDPEEIFVDSFFDVFIKVENFQPMEDFYNVSAFVNGSLEYSATNQMIMMHDVMTHTFNMSLSYSGSFPLHIVVVATNAGTFEYWDTIEVYDEENYDFAMYIVQDNYAFPDEQVWMDFVFEWYLPTGIDEVFVMMDVFDLENNESYWSESHHFDLVPHDKWVYHYETNFPEGEYDVFFAIDIPEYGFYERYCWWEITNDFIDVWINQDMHAFTNENREMRLEAKNHYSTSVYVNFAELWIEDPTGYNEMIFWQYNFTLNSGDHWSNNTFYNFTQEGHYKIHFNFGIDNGKVYEAFCHWEVEVLVPDWLDIWIWQEMNVGVGQNTKIDAFVQSYFTEVIFADNMSLEISGPNNFDKQVFFKSNVELFPYPSQPWMLQNELVFSEKGEYEVTFWVYYQGYMYETHCHYTVVDWEHFELSIEQEKDAVVGENKSMTFKIQSFFSHNMTDVKVDIAIKNLNISIINVNLFHDETIDLFAYSTWTTTLTYRFPQVGVYEVQFLLEDDIGAKWEALCYWKVTDGTGLANETDKPIISISGITDGGIYTGNISATISISDDSAIDANSGKLLLNGMGIDMDVGNYTSIVTDNPLVIKFDFNTSLVLDGTYKFTATVSDIYGNEGSLTLVIHINNTGTLVLPEDTTTVSPEDSSNEESETDLLAATPGFETFVLLLGLMTTLGFYRKYRK